MSGIIFSFFPDAEMWITELLGALAKPVFLIFDLFVIFLLVKIGISLGNKIIGLNIRRVVKRDIGEKKVSTASTVAKSIWRYIVYFIALIAVLNLFNLGGTVGGLLATAGIGGLAIGFGAQSLIKDIISGLFLLFENQIAVGDYVSLAGITGTIEEIQLRVTKVRSYEGEVNIIPNGQITIVTNYSKGNNKAIIDIPVPYEQDVSIVISVINDAMEQLFSANDKIIAKPEVVGAVQFGELSITLRVVADCRSMEHFSVEREMRKYVIDAFEAHGIKFPNNKVVTLNHK